MMISFFLPFFAGTTAPSVAGAAAAAADIVTPSFFGAIGRRTAADVMKEIVESMRRTEAAISRGFSGQ